MKVNNLIKKLEAQHIKFDIVADRTQWGHYVRLAGRVNGYYDIEATNQIRFEEAATPEAAIEAFKNSDIGYFCSKPYHDQSDMMSDYCAWSFNHRVKDIDWLLGRAIGREVATV